MGWGNEHLHALSLGTANPTGPNKYFGSLAAYITSYLGDPGALDYRPYFPGHDLSGTLATIPKTLTAADYSPPVKCPVPYYIHQFLRANPTDDTSPATSPKRVYYPFGRPSLQGSETPPGGLLADGSAPMSKVSNIQGGATHWAITDDDQQLNGGGTYAAWLPPRAVHGTLPTSLCATIFISTFTSRPAKRTGEEILKREV